MTPLRKQMIDAMRQRGYSVRTHQSYLGAVTELAQFHRRSPDQLTIPDLQAFFAHLALERELSGASCRIYLGAVRFFYLHVLGWEHFNVPVAIPKKPQRIPELLTRAEVARILAASENPKHRMALTTCYGCGLRVSELVAVQVRHIDGERELLRVEQGKGAKDRMVILSTTLLEQLRVFWKLYRPAQWLFPGCRPDVPIAIATMQKVFLRAKRRAGIEKIGGIHSLRHAYATRPTATARTPQRRLDDALRALGAELSGASRPQCRSDRGAGGGAMNAPGTDLQSVLGAFLPRYLEGRALHPRQRQVCAHIETCRTPALGGYVEGCERCEYRGPVRYRSCRDRHCPKCQGRASLEWSERERQALLPVTYHHLVLTVPDALNHWVQLYPRALYAQLFESAWATLSAFAADPRRLGGQLGGTAALHTWGQTLTQHVHLHWLIPGGVLTEAGLWRAARGNYLFPVRALSRRFRGHFVAGLRRRALAGELERTAAQEVDAMLDALMATEWIVYTKPCLGHAERVVAYLARYTHRTALSDRRLLGVEGGRVALRYTDYRDRRREKVLWLEGTELIRRFLLHVLPKGFM